MDAKLPIPISGSCRAQYADGYIYDETAHNDVGQFGDLNVFDDIKHKRPEKDHGKLTRFTVFYDGYRYDFDFSQLPDNARPIRFKHMELDSIGGVIIEQRLMSVDAGYQYNDETGKNVKEVIEL
jgi:hypothetical protein